MMWANFSAWLVSVGVIFGYLAAIFSRSSRQPVHPRSTASVAARNWERRRARPALRSTCFVHSRDAWTSVVPWGIALSAATVLILLFTVWMGRRRWSYEHRVGSRNEVHAVKLLSVALKPVLTLTLRPTPTSRSIFRQVNPNPVLLDIQQYPFPQMHLIGRWVEKRRDAYGGSGVESGLPVFSIRARSIRSQRGRPDSQIEAPHRNDHQPKRPRHAVHRKG